MKSVINMWTESKYVLLLKSKRIKCNGILLRVPSLSASVLPAKSTKIHFNWKIQPDPAYSVSLPL